jgi:hypothetical protein
MMERCPPDARVGIQHLGPVPEGCCQLCRWCTELDADCLIRSLVAGEVFVEHVCSPCAEAIGLDLDATPVLTDEPVCESLDYLDLNRCNLRRTVEYRA